MTTDSPFVPTQHPVHYNTIRVNELDIFYREAGLQTAPTILLLHGFPTSSNMFRNLIPRLATSFHVVAPDYPGFGQSSMPSHKDFEYTFENLTNVVEQLVEKLALANYSLYVMDYGAPVGYRLALRHPERVQALIVQNGNAYEEGLLRVLEPNQKILEGSYTRESERASASWSIRSRHDGNMKTAWPTGRFWIRQPGH